MVSQYPEVPDLEEVCLWEPLAVRYPVSMVTGSMPARSDPSILLGAVALTSFSLPYLLPQKGQVKGQEASIPCLSELSEP